SSSSAASAGRRPRRSAAGLPRTRSAPGATAPPIFPRDPDFLEKAGRVLDLYQGRWEGRLLEPGDLVICADAKPSIQARRRIHPSAPPAPGRGQLVEHEYERKGALCYLDAWDVRRGAAI